MSRVICFLALTLMLTLTLALAPVRAANAAVTAGATVTAVTAGADLVLNEVLYDPAGEDQGAEFVELWNPDSVAQSLAGVLVEAGDGARPGSWTTVYAGSAGDAIPPRGAFLVAGSMLVAALQNGPDAVRLSRGVRVLDLLGYGALAAAELSEGAPAPDAASGQSLARRGDGIDTDGNAADWDVEPSPTPGRANHPDARLAFVRAATAVAPEVPWPGDLVRIRVEVRNAGRLAVSGARWRLEVDLVSAAETPDGPAWPARPTAQAAGATIAAGESVGVDLSFFAPAPGPFFARVRLADTVEDPASAGIADTVVTALRSTAGPAVVNEVAFRDTGAGEWVELFFRDPVEDLGRIALADHGTKAYDVDRGTAPRAARAGGLLVVAESPDRVRARYALPESVVVGLRGGWPVLNDAEGPDGVADLVRAFLDRGAPMDAVPYRPSQTARGGSLERLDPSLRSGSPETWAESIDPAGATPGRPNSLRAPDGGHAGGAALLLASARVLRRDPGASPGAVVLRVTSEARGERLRVRVHDLLGRPRRLLVDGQRFSGESAFVWDGRDDSGAPVPPGIYLVRAETLPDGDVAPKTASLAVTVVERRAR